MGRFKLKAEHEQQLAKVAAELSAMIAANLDAEVDIEGQASVTGTDPANDVLAQKRAEAVRDALVSSGIPKDKIRITSAGSRKSRSEETQEDLARSRAVRIVRQPRVAPPPSATPPNLPPPGRLPNGRPCPPIPARIIMDMQGSDVVAVTGPFAGVRAGNPPATAGMEVSVPILPLPPACGQLSWVQNVMPFREIVYKDGSRNRIATSGFVLDSSDPYPCHIQVGQGLPIPTANDSPAHGVSSNDAFRVSALEVRDEFRMFFMIQPAGGTRVAVAVGAWNWIGMMRSDDARVGFGRLILDTSMSRISPQSDLGVTTSAMPALSPNVSSLKWKTDPGGADPVNCIAAKHAVVMNQAPLPPPKPTGPCSLKPPPPPPVPTPGD